MNLFPTTSKSLEAFQLKGQRKMLGIRTTWQGKDRGVVQESQRNEKRTLKSLWKGRTETAKKIRTVMPFTEA